VPCLLNLWSSEAIIIVQWSQQSPDNTRKICRISFDYCMPSMAKLLVVRLSSSTADLSELLAYQQLH
jgi:hypothetical protein